jgi:CBS-domain-containing membrane protein
MRAMDVMTSRVITVGENATVPEATKLMADHGISAVPVIDKHNRVIGMVSEGDLLHRAETGTELRRSWWLETGTSTDQLAAEYIKSHSGKAGEVMTRGVISVIEQTAVADIAVLLETHRIKRVPVLRDGKLVGIVSRANLVRALAMTINGPPSVTEADDRAIRDRLLAELKAQKWAEVSPANVTVNDGVVHLWSSYLSDHERRALVLLAENTPGVRRVEDHMRSVPTHMPR